MTYIGLSVAHTLLHTLDCRLLPSGGSVLPIQDAHLGSRFPPQNPPGLQPFLVKVQFKLSGARSSGSDLYSQHSRAEAGGSLQVWGQVSKNKPAKKHAGLGLKVPVTCGLWVGVALCVFWGLEVLWPPGLGPLCCRNSVPLTWYRFIWMEKR